MHHNQIVAVLGRCDCPCHQRREEPCWCAGTEPDPLEISHNDRILVFGSCDCRHRTCTHQGATDPAIRRQLDAHLEQERERRIRRGRPRPSDITHIVRHPGRYPGYGR